MDKNDAIAAFAALAQGTRLDVVRCWCAPGRMACPPAISARRSACRTTRFRAHLALLTRAGLVRPRREGRSIIYAPDFGGMQTLVGFLLQDCCDGRPEVCRPVLDAMQAACCGPAERIAS
jgi:hypothetical protein